MALPELNLPDTDLLGKRIAELVDRCKSLQKMQQQLANENDKLRQERDDLRTKTNMVYERVRGMIVEIKNLESKA